MINHVWLIAVTNVPGGSLARLFKGARPAGGRPARCASRWCPARCHARPGDVGQGERGAVEAGQRRPDRATANCACRMRGRGVLFQLNPKARPRKRRNSRSQIAGNLLVPEAENG